MVPPWSRIHLATELAAPLRSCRPSRSTPDILVVAVNSTQWAWLSSPGERSRSP